MRARYGIRNDFQPRLYDSPGWKRICAMHSLCSDITSSNPVSILPAHSGTFALKETYSAVRPSRPTLLSYVYIWHRKPAPCYTVVLMAVLLASTLIT